MAHGGGQGTGGVPAQQAPPGVAPMVSVLMPTYEQAAFIGRALASLQAQTLARWELIIVDDGSQDDTALALALAPWLSDARIRYQRLAHNEGLGRALNRALDAASAPLIAYLPSDDVFHADHLERLAAALAESPDVVLACSGLRHHGNRHAEGRLPGSWLQLVQCMHRRVDLRWVERAELESDDLDRLFWTRLQTLGNFVGTGRVSCEWTEHPAQRHKLMQEPPGGINPFRQRYRVREPLRFHTTTGNAIDEPGLYRALRERQGAPSAASDGGGLTIVLVGELAYNAERVLALAEAGHRLYGLWTDTPYWYNTIGPLPFGHVEDLPRDGWLAALKRLRPDLIYGLLNWQAVPFAHAVLMATPGIPFVWHFKEGPFICMEKGSWPQLLELYRRANGQVYSSIEMRDWFDSVSPGLSAARPSLVLDGDLPKREWFEGATSPLLSALDGEPHTVVPGRPIGLHPHTVAELAQQGIHLHFYGDFTQGQWREWIARAQGLAPRHLHLHANVTQDRWVDEFSRYDAGWLHCFNSRNGGEIRRADWDDLNLPARIATLAMAGVPMIQRDNGGAIVAAQALVRAHDIGLFYREIDELGAQLREPARMAGLRDRV
jgi:hypothetical protein